MKLGNRKQIITFNYLQNEPNIQNLVLPCSAVYADSLAVGGTETGGARFRGTIKGISDTQLHADANWIEVNLTAPEDGSVSSGLGAGEDFEYEGIIYTVIDPQARTCQTKEGKSYRNPGNTWEGDLVLPERVSIGNEEYTVIAIGENGFTGCTGLTSIVFPPSLTSIGYSAFNGCSGLTSIELPSSLTSIEDGAFYGCSGLTSIELPSSLTSIGSGAFHGCSGLTSIELPSSLTSIGAHAFEYCSGLTSIELPSSLTSIGSGAFHSCTGLTSIKIPDSIVVIESGVFEYCISLGSIEFPSSLTTIDYQAFSGCRSLTSIELPSSLAKLGDSAFANCRGLTSVSLPASLTTIESSVFNYCVAIRTINYYAVTPIVIEENVFSDAVYLHALLNTPNVALSDVLTTPTWNQFKHINAKDGSVSPENFEYEGLIYTVIDPQARTCQTKVGESDTCPGNTWEGDLVIPEKAIIDNIEYTVTAIGSYGFAKCDELTSVSLPESITEIGKAAFAKCGRLLSIDIPQSLTTIRESAFYDCSSLTAIELPASVTTIESSSFASCANLISINLPNGIKEIREETFSGCDNLTSIEIPESVNNIGDGAFVFCSSLTSINIPESVNSIGHNAFNGCMSLTSINIPESVNSIGWWAFSDCSGLTSVSLPASLTTIGGGVFKGCNAIDTVNYYAVNPIGIEEHVFSETAYKDALLNTPNAALADVLATRAWNLFQNIDAKDGSVSPGLGAGEEFEYEGIFYTVIDPQARTCQTKAGGTTGYGFETAYGGNNWEGNLVIPEKAIIDNIEYTVTEIGSYGFAQCDKLTSVSLPESITIIKSYAFLNCSSLLSINLSQSLKTIGEYTFFNCSSLTAIQIPATVTTIEGNTFRNCINLSSINIPNGIKEISQSIFEGCSSLNSLEIPESVNKIGSYAFKGCSNLTSINIPDAVTSILPRTFEGCSSLNSITLPTSLKWIGQYVFAGCSSLNSIDLPESIDQLDEGIFDGCVGLTSINIPGNVNKIPAYMLRGCSSLTSIELPETISWINGGAFSGCSSLTSITLPPMISQIAINTFEDCSSLTSIQLPNALTSIGRFAFNQCSSLASIDLPASMTEILENAFYGCTNLFDITYRASLPIVIETDVFPESLYETATLTMPNAALADVLATESWNMFKHINAKDGSVSPGLGAGEEFEYEGIFYTVIDAEARTCQTKPGYTNTPEGEGTTVYGGNEQCNGNLFIPEIVYNDNQEYTVVGIGYCGFSGSKISSISFPPTLTSVGDYAFFACDNLMTADWPETVPYLPSYAFSGCENLVSLHLPETLERISSSALSYCSALDTLSFPSHLIEIENYAVTNCTSLRKVSINGEQTQIGFCAFEDSPNLTTLSLRGTFDVEQRPFWRCPISSLEWKRKESLPNEIVDCFDNPNMLVYVDSIQFAPDGRINNIVVNNEAEGRRECSSLVLTQGYPFHAEHAFVAANSSMTMDFSQTTTIGVCAGWETIVLPFDVAMITARDGLDELTPFALLTDINTQLPFWLYKADSASEWESAPAIRAGVPYIISMPNNKEYDPKYNITGPVTFTGQEDTMIETYITAPYSLTWPSGYQFRSLWLPLTYPEAEQAMGLNVGIDNLYDDEGNLLPPGSAFHAGVRPRPLEAYVIGNGSRMALPVMGGQTHVELLVANKGLGIDAEDGAILLKSDTDRTVGIYRIDGVCVRMVELKAGETAAVSDLAKGLYIVGGQKIIVK